MSLHLAIETVGENSLLLRAVARDGGPATVDAALCVALAELRRALLERFGEQLVDVVPAYNSLLLTFDILRADPASLRAAIEALLASHRPAPASAQRQLHIPVYYGEEVGPDLAKIAREQHCSIAQVAERHWQTDYTVYSLGFAPGFAYLGFVRQDIASRRLARPRPRVAAGSVGIADRQTGVYPSASPGGWNIIGRTPLATLSQRADGSVHSLMVVGDSVRFQPIDRAEFLALGGSLGQG